MDIDAGRLVQIAIGIAMLFATFALYKWRRQVSDMIYQQMGTLAPPPSDKDSDVDKGSSAIIPVVFFLPWLAIFFIASGVFNFGE